MSNSNTDPIIHFFSEDVPFQMESTDHITEWIMASIASEKKSLDTITFIFCSDEYLLDLNLTHLQHNTYTDIISFPYSEEPIQGDIFISVDRVKENAENYNVEMKEELHRVIIHGVLHFCGYRDKTPDEKKTMRSKENYYLSLI